MFAIQTRGSRFIALKSPKASRLARLGSKGPLSSSSTRARQNLSICNGKATVPTTCCTRGLLTSTGDWLKPQSLPNTPHLEWSHTKRIGQDPLNERSRRLAVGTRRSAFHVLEQERRSLRASALSQEICQTGRSDSTDPSILQDPARLRTYP